MGKCGRIDSEFTNLPITNMTGNPELLCKNPEVINHNHRFDEENGGFSRMLDKLLGDKKNTPIGKEVYDNAMQKA